MSTTIRHPYSAPMIVRPAHARRGSSAAVWAVRRLLIVWARRLRTVSRYMDSIGAGTLGTMIFTIVATLVGFFGGLATGIITIGSN